MRPVAEWDEDFVLSLPSGENDQFERKGTLMLDVTAGANEGKARDELAKQLSAFANAGGGQIIYGLTDDGSVDSGGVSEAIRGSTKEWLEDLIPGLTDFEIVGVNVKPIASESTQSQLEKGKALYIVDVPDSDRAPHQSTRDRRYYVRLGGKSFPASHRLIEDIRNRAKHPKIDLRIGLGDIVCRSLRFDQKDLSLLVPIQIQLQNLGVLKSQNTCFYFEINVACPAVNSFSESLAPHSGDHFRNHSFWELAVPLYPGMTIDATIELALNVAITYSAKTVGSPYPAWVETANPQCDLQTVDCGWTLFADNAPPKRGTVTLGDLRFNARMKEMLEYQPNFQEIQGHWGRFPK